MSEKPIISISGIRGIVGKSLTVGHAVDFSAAFGTHLRLRSGADRPVVVLGRDSRTSGGALALAVKAGLAATGCRVVDLGIVPTPTVAIYIELMEAAGGTVITASHNPAEWNGLKFMNSRGLFPDEEEAGAILRIIEDASFRWAGYGEMSPGERRDDAIAIHLDRIMELPVIDADPVRRRNFRVALDTVRGAGGPIMKQLVERLGGRVEGINLETDGAFPRDPEPRWDNLGNLCQLVQETGADLGLAVDPDVDRLTLVDERGEPVVEEMTVVLAAQYILSKKTGPLAVNLSTTRAMDDLAERYGVKLFRSKVGEINVVKEMIRTGAVVGGEGNGGVILPELHMGRDAPLAAALILSLLAQTGRRLSHLVGEHRRYHMVKIKYRMDEFDPAALLNRLRDRTPSEKTDLRDGLRLDFPYGWIHARKSNTEPIVRAVIEADTEENLARLRRLTDEALS